MKLYKDKRGEKMSDLPKVFIGVLIGILIIGGAIMLFSHPNSDTTNVTEQNVTEQNVSDGGSISDVIQEKVQTLTNQQNVANNTVQNAQNYNSNSTNTYSNSNSNNGNSGSGQQNQYQVSGGHSEKNYQAGQGEFYEISYSDGNFRQYDTKTGELVGSSFDEDQEKLGVVDGDLV